MYGGPVMSGVSTSQLPHRLVSLRRTQRIFKTKKMFQHPISGMIYLVGFNPTEKKLLVKLDSISPGSGKNKQTKPSPIVNSWPRKQRPKQLGPPPFFIQMKPTHFDDPQLQE